jgi:hypothetical protein
MNRLRFLAGVGIVIFRTVTEYGGLRAADFVRTTGAPNG